MVLEKSLIRFEDQLYWIDMEDAENLSFLVVSEDGTTRPWKAGEADLFEVMETGVVIGHSLPKKE